MLPTAKFLLRLALDVLRVADLGRHLFARLDGARLERLRDCARLNEHWTPVMGHLLLLSVLLP